jgi:uncharacterized protein (DUF1330 family)
MPAYVVVEIRITDPELYEQVKQQTPPVVAAYGGKYLARGGHTEALHGDWSPERLVVIEFESIEQARRWYDSPEYRQIRVLRDQSAQVNMVLTEGKSPT